MRFKQNLVLDKNHIWIRPNQQNADICYPDEGIIVNRQFEKFSFWFRHRNQIILRVINNFPFINNFVDIGGGNGYQTTFLSENFPSREFYLIEPSYAGCLNAVKRNLKHIYNINAFDFNYNKHYIGGVGLFDVLEHVNDQILLRQLVKLCPRKCFFYITVPAYSWLWSDVDDFGKHRRRYTLTYLKRLADICNIKQIFASHFFSYLPPLIFIARSLPYRLGIKKNSVEIINNERRFHNPLFIIKKIFTKVNQWEINRIRNHQVIVFGSSCIAVYQK